jgi:hypothetical protein
MHTRRSLRNVITRPGGSVPSARCAPSPGTARAQLTRRMAVPALVLVSVGAIAAASPAAAQAAPTQHQAKSARACATKHQRPWMYANSAGRPWMYAAPAGRPWMYAAPAGRPWMYAKVNGSATKPRACQKTARKATA